VLSLLVLAAYLVVPFLDSTFCEDCRESVPFSDKVRLCHLEAPHADVTPCSGNVTDSDEESSPGKESKSICSICVNSAAETCSTQPEPLHSIGSQIMQLTSCIPLDPSFPINKPPQNSLDA
jgi:hypothetical protein